MVLFLFLLILFSLIWKSQNIFLFLLSIEVSMVFLSLLVLKLGFIYFFIVIMIGVLEAILGLMLMVLYLRHFGSDMIMF